MSAIEPLLKKGLNVLSKFGINFETKPEDAGLVRLLEGISHIDKPRVLAIARTAQYIGVFNEAVNENIDAVNYSDRYKDINKIFDSIISDAQTRFNQAESDNELSYTEKLRNFCVDITKGSIHDRFEEIRKLYKDVTFDTEEQIKKEKETIEAYTSFRFAVKNASIVSDEVVKIQKRNLEKIQEAYEASSTLLEKYQKRKVIDAVEKGKLELARDKARDEFKKQDSDYNLVIKTSLVLSQLYDGGDAVYAKSSQITEAKVLQHQNLVTTYTLASTIITGLDNAINALLGLHEATEVSKETREVMNRGLEFLAKTGNQVMLDAVKEATRPTLEPAAIKQLFDSLADAQKKSYAIISEQRALSLKAREEISDYAIKTASEIADITDKYIKGELKSTPVEEKPKELTA